MTIHPRFHALIGIILSSLLMSLLGDNVIAEETGLSKTAVPQVTIGIIPNGPNIVKFPPVQAKFLRVEVLASFCEVACFDELEVFGPNNQKNLAAASTGALASASSCIKGYDSHAIEFLNDGKYGNARSWIPATLSAWAQIEFPKITEVDQVIVSRDRISNMVDRLATQFDVEVSLDGKKWTKVCHVTGLANTSVKSPLPNELPSGWAMRLAYSIKGPCHKTAIRLAEKVTTLEEAQVLVDLSKKDVKLIETLQKLNRKFDPVILRRTMIRKSLQSSNEGLTTKEIDAQIANLVAKAAEARKKISSYANELEIAEEGLALSVKLELTVSTSTELVLTAR